VAEVGAVGSLRYALWGSSGHAKVLASLVRARGGVVVATFDNDAGARPLDGVSLHVGPEGFAAWARSVPDRASIRALVAIGGRRGADRLALQALMVRHGLVAEPLVHPDASVCPTARIGAGSQVLARAVVAADAVLGAACIVNHAASIDHESTLGDGVHVAPGATLCGCVTVGDRVLIGAGAVVLPRVSIGADACIGAGAVVTRDVPPGAVVAGNPARAIRQEGQP
jgi:sugar O-acyltransferase (sialic acid O-acetyltransferase NeuD family)